MGQVALLLGALLRQDVRLERVLALQLARAGVPTVLMEQYPMPHTRGASHGASRVIRLLGDDNLAALEYSYAAWEELEKLTGETLLVRTGLINLGPDGDEYLAKYMAIVHAGGYRAERVAGDRERRARRLDADRRGPAAVAEDGALAKEGPVGDDADDRITHRLEQNF